MRRLTIGERARILKLLATSTGFMTRAPYLSLDEMQSRQLEHLRELVRHAYETVPFYRTLYESVCFEPGDLRAWEDFARLPTVAKEEVIQSYPDRIISNRFKGSDLLVSRSSGSSGRVLDVAYSVDTLARYALATIRMYSMGFDYRPWHRHVYIYTSEYPFDSIFGLYPLHFVPTLTPISVILETLVRVGPQLLVCYPSHLRQIFEAASDAQRDRIRPLLISVSSELSTQAERDDLGNQFGCPALDNYSSEEMARIAGQCLEKNYHVFEDMNFVEVLDESGTPTCEPGRVVATNLWNFAAPLIRYEQDDHAKIVKEACPCARRFRILSSLQGRVNDSFHMPSGRVLTSGFLLDATYEFLLDDRESIRDFCLIQDTPRSVRLEVVPGRTWSRSRAGRIARRFNRYLEAGVEFRVIPVRECEKTRTGKRNPIISRVGAPGTARRDPPGSDAFEHAGS